MKRICSMILALALVIACLPVFPLEVHAVTIASGECGDNVTWTLDDAGRLTISGTGDMDDYAYPVNTPWFSHGDSVKALVIANGVTGIGKHAFSALNNLISVEIPDSVTRIGAYAFFCSTGLADVNIPNRVTSIGEYAFSHCSGLTGMRIPDSVTSIGDYAFDGCTGLTVLEISNSITSIGVYTFGSCTGLTSVEIPGSVTELDAYAFYGCENLTSVTIPDSVKTIGTFAFLGCRSLTSITIPGSVTYIGEKVFQSCANLREITFEGDAPVFDKNAFFNVIIKAYYPASNATWTADVRQNYGSRITWVPYGTIASGNCGDDLTWKIDADGTLIISGTGAMYDYDASGSIIPWHDHKGQIKSVVIQRGVTGIASSTFSGCTNLTEIVVDEENPNYSNDLFGVLFNQDKTTLICCPGGKAGSYEIPASVTGTDAFAFAGCTKLTDITFLGNAPSFGGSDVFSQVTATAHYPGNNQTWTLDVLRDYGGTITWAAYGENAQFIAVGSCGMNLTWTLAANGILTISGNGAMVNFAADQTPWYSYRDSIKSVVVDSGITSIGRYAFAFCVNLTQVTIGNSVTDIGNSAFLSCTSLSSITIPNSVKTIGTNAFETCTSLTTVTIPDSVTSIDSSAFAYCSGLTSVTIPDSVIVIGNYAFSNCTGLASVTIPDSVTVIGYGTFRGCSSLSGVTIPNSITDISNFAFENCASLTNVTIPASVTDIGNYAFCGCTGLKEITFEGNAPNLGDQVFGDVTATAYYPADNNTWTEDVLQNYSGVITWVPYGDESSDTNSGKCGDNVNWKYEDGTLTISGTGKMYDYDSNDRSPWYNYRNSVKAVIIENEVTSIGNSAFFNCNNLTSVTTGDGVTSIGYLAFEGCEALSEVVIGDRVTSIGSLAFAGCHGLSKVTMGTSVASIGDGAFSSVGNFGEIIFTGNAPSIPSGAFDFAVGTIYYPADNTTWTANIMQDYGQGPITWVPYQNGPAVIASGKCGANLTWKLTEDGVLTISGTGPMDDFMQDPWQYPYVYPTWIDYAYDSIKSVVIEDGVTSIGNWAFAHCYTMTSIDISNTVTTIGTEAFWESGLTSVDIPNSVTSIGDYAFIYCAKLENVTVGKGVTSIGEGAFFCCGLKQIIFKGSAPTFGDGAFGDVTATAYYYPNATWTEDVLQNYGGKITWVAMEMPKLSLGGEEFADQDTVWIEGLPYPIQGEGNDRYVELPTEDDCYMVTYTYHTGDANDVHTQYPTGMKVYKISEGEITHIPQLDNLLQYSGASIRITGKKGIRMITSLTKTNKTALTGKGLAGFKLLEYGTALCFAHEIPQGDALVLGRDFTRSNYAYKKGVADPVFASTKDLIQYTNVLVGFSLDQCKDDIAMRPYIILEDAAGNQITLYGGTIYRSIGYIAYQNRTVFTPKTASYNYVWEIIHHVYGDKYDADYKG